MLDEPRQSVSLMLLLLLLLLLLPLLLLLLLLLPTQARIANSSTDVPLAVSFLPMLRLMFL